MKKIMLFLCTAIFALSCAKYSIKNEISYSSMYKKLHASGVIIRTPNDSIVTLADYRGNLAFWLSGVERTNAIMQVTNSDDSLVSSESAYDRFYQLSTNGKFLKFKSIGVITMYVKNNKALLKRIMEENKLDSFILYEVDSAYTVEMQFIDFESVIVVLDGDLNIAYLDHQVNVYNVSEYDPDLVKKHVLDAVSDRFIATMSNLNYVRQLSSKKIRNLSEKEEPVPAPAEKPVEQPAPQKDVTPKDTTQPAPANDATQPAPANDVTQPADTKDVAPAPKEEAAPAEKPATEGNAPAVEGQKPADSGETLQQETPAGPKMEEYTPDNQGGGEK